MGVESIIFFHFSLSLRDFKVPGSEEVVAISFFSAQNSNKIKRNSFYEREKNLKPLAPLEIPFVTVSNLLAPLEVLSVMGVNLALFLLN